MSTLLLALALAMDGGVAGADGPTVTYATGDGECPEPGVELAQPTPDGGAWIVPAPRFTAFECRLAACEEQIVKAKTIAGPPSPWWIVALAILAFAGGVGVGVLATGAAPRAP